MRRILSVGMIAAGGFASSVIGTGAMAADFGGTALRGSIAPPPYQDSSPWDGFYVGGSAAYSSGDFKPRTSGYSALAPQLKGTTLDAGANLASDLSAHNGNGREGAYGGFIGYNTTWEDVVIGIEADYQNTDVKFNSTTSVSRQFIDSVGVNNAYTASSQVASRITDIATLRGRAGYAYGNALPYLTIGVGVIHGKSTVNASVNDVGTDTNAPQKYLPFNVTYTAGYANRDKWAVGFAVGAGVDYALTQSIFLRAEYQYLRFNSFDGVEVNLNNAKVGVAAKF